MYTRIQHEPKVLGVRTTSFASRHPLHAERVVVFLKASKTLRVPFFHRRHGVAAQEWMVKMQTIRATSYKKLRVFNQRLNKRLSGG